MTRCRDCLSHGLRNPLWECGERFCDALRHATGQKLLEGVTEGRVGNEYRGEGVKKSSARKKAKSRLHGEMQSCRRGDRVFFTVPTLQILAGNIDKQFLIFEYLLKVECLKPKPKITQTPG